MYRPSPYSDLRSGLLYALGCLLACAPLPPDEKSPNSDSVEPTAAHTAALLTGSDPGSSINGTNLGKGLRVFFGPHLSTASVCRGPTTYPKRGTTPITGVRLEKTELVGYEAGSLIRGTQFKGVEFCGELGAKHDPVTRITTPGSEVIVLLEDVNVGAELLNYTIVFKEESGISPVCTPNPETGKQHNAWPIQGDWTSRSRVDSTSVFTFACRISALAKCLKSQKYLPWGSPDGDNLFVACTRMMRADYCGNGDSHTRNGIQLYFHTNSGAFPWGDMPMTTRPEAIWSAQGAVCLTNYRDTDPGSCGGRLRSCAGFSLLSGQLEARINAAPVVPDPSKCTLTSSMGTDCL